MYPWNSRRLNTSHDAASQVPFSAPVPYQAGPIAITHDLFGSDFDAAIVKLLVDPSAAKCQAEVLKRSGKLFDELWKLTKKAKRDALTCSAEAPPSFCSAVGLGRVTSSLELQTTIADAIGADARGKIAKTAATLIEKTLAKCAAVVRPMALMFPGACSWI